MLSLFAALVSLTLAQTGSPATPSKEAPPASTPDAAGPYHVISTFRVGGDGAWDSLPRRWRVQAAVRAARGTRVMVLNSETGETVGEIADTQGVHDVALATELGEGFTSDGKSGNVTVFDLKSLKTIQTVKAGENPDAMIYEPTTKRVYCFNGKSKDATVINAEDLTVASTIPMGGKPEFAVVDDKGKVFVNVEDTSELVRIDAATMKVEARWKLSPGEEPSGLAIDAKNGRLFAACANQKMIVVDTASGKILATPAIGKGVDGAVFDPAGFAMSSNGDGSLSVISTSGDKFEPVQTLTTAPRWRTVTIDPKSRRIYLPTAEFETAKEGERRPPMKPGTFKIIVVGP